MKFNIHQMELDKVIKFAILSTKDPQGNNKNIVNEVVIEAKKGEGIKLLFLDEHVSAVYGRVVYKSVDVDEDGIFGILDVRQFKDMLTLFDHGSKLTVFTEDNNLFLERKSPYKKIKIPILNDETARKIIENTSGIFSNLEKTDKGWKSPRFEWNSYAKILSTYLREILRNTKLLSATNYVFPLEMTPEKLTFKMESYDKTTEIEEVLPTELIVTDEIISEKYSYGVDGIFEQVEGVIKLFFKTGAPIIIERVDEGDNLEAVYVAMRQEE